MREVGADLVRWRSLKVEGVPSLKKELAEETERWLEHLPDHGRSAYKSNIFPTSHCYASSVASSVSLLVTHCRT